MLSSTEYWEDKQNEDIWGEREPVNGRLRKLKWENQLRKVKGPRSVGA
jgi:hypothetical protein